MLVILSALTITSTQRAAGNTVSYQNAPGTLEVLADSYGSEIGIAANPTNFKNVVIAHNYVWPTPTSSPVRYSTDGGYSWGSSVIGQYLWGDPFLAFDASGNLYYSSFYGIATQIQVSKSTDGGATFAAPKVLAKEGSPVKFQTGGNSNGVIINYGGMAVDFPKIACDRSSSAYRNNVYVTFTGMVCTDGDGYPEYSGTVFTRSTDGGSTWGQLTPISARASKDTWKGNMAMNIGIGADGAIYIAMESAPFIVKSMDGGLTFTAPVAIFPNPGAVGLTSNFNRFPVIVPSPTQVNVIYLAFSAIPLGSSDYDIFVSKSTDSGVTWQRPVRVNDDAINNGVLQHNPFMSAAADGRLDISWWDYRYSTGTSFADMYYAYSADGGTTFCADVRLTSTTTKFDRHEGMSNDYSTVVSLPGEAVAAYAYPQPANPGGTMDAYVNHIYLAPVHNINSNAYFATIQGAIDAASASDTIEVSPGTYGLIQVAKPLTIISTNGPDLTTIDGGAMTSDSVYVTANNVRIEGFTIENGNSGVSLNGCSGAVVTGNNIVQNGLAGVWIYGASNNQIVGNKISTPLNCGVLMDLFGSPSHNTISNNLISGCVAAIYMQSGYQNLLTHNSIVGNEYGVILYVYSADNIVHHNSFVDNTFQALDSTSGINYWDDGVSAGNYWSDYAGHDSNGDGIGDTPYLIPDTGKQDNYPLIAVQGPRLTVLAVNENGQALADVPVYIDQVPAGTTAGVFTVLHGSHSVSVNAEFITAGREYAFQKWTDVTAGASRTGEFFADQTLTAQYAIEKVQNSNTGLYYSTIGQAVAAASPGNTILVGAGTYYEYVSVDSSKTSLILKGEGASTTVIDSRLIGCQMSVDINAANVVFQGFAIKPWLDGVEVRGSGAIIRDNVISDGIGAGIWTLGVSTPTLTNNRVERCGIGMLIGAMSLTSTGSSIVGNVLDGNGIGLELAYSNGAVVRENKIQHNNIGILLGRDGSLAGDAEANTIYHNNFVSNAVQASIQSIATVLNNKWDNGATSGGNYWSNYAGTDANGDGYGDTAYVINTNNKDNYPLMTPWGETPSVKYKLTVLGGYYNTRGSWVALTGTVWIDTVSVGNTGATFTVAAGTHTVQVKDPIVSKGKTYHFQYWLGGIPSSNPGSITLSGDTTIRAVYSL